MSPDHRVAPDHGVGIILDGGKEVMSGIQSSVVAIPLLAESPLYREKYAGKYDGLLDQ